MVQQQDEDSRDAAWKPTTPGMVSDCTGVISLPDATAHWAGDDDRRIPATAFCIPRIQKENPLVGIEIPPYGKKNKKDVRN